MELQITAGADVKLCVEDFRLGCLPSHGVVELYAVVRGSEPTQLARARKQRGNRSAFVRPSIGPLPWWSLMETSKIMGPDGPRTSLWAHSAALQSCGFRLATRFVFKPSLAINPQWPLTGKIKDLTMSCIEHTLVLGHTNHNLLSNSSRSD